MDSNQIIPFERNRYYVGKMLTSADFKAEQTYFNNKRRFINSMMFGPGIVCGLGVYNLDDLSVMIDSGVALDGSGREIVIDTSIVKRLSVIEGFESLTSAQVALCLKYREEEIHPVYSVNRQDKQEEYEYNRISESFDLFLTDISETEKTIGFETEFFQKGQLYKDKHHSVTLTMPGVASQGKKLKLILSLEKLSEEKREFNFETVLQMPAFFGPDGGHELRLEFKDIKLTQGQTVRKEYWITAQDMQILDTSMLIKNNRIQVGTNGDMAEHTVNLTMKLSIAAKSPSELVKQEIGKSSLELRRVNTDQDYIVLAEILLLRTDSAYIIEGVNENQIRRYIPTLADEALREEYLEYYEQDTKVPVASDHKEDIVNEDIGPVKQYTKPRFASGILEIPLGINLKKGDIRYSGEIMHGLGKGNVYVKVGLEYLAEDISLGASAKNTIYGPAELFAEDKLPISQVETAIKVMNDKGSFIVAVRLLGETEYVMLTLRWVAIRFGDDQNIELTESYTGRSIMVETPTIVMATKDKYFFQVKFKNMEPCSLIYELTEAGSGEITSEGVYTAPAKEGVYEIKISCADASALCAYAYAVVKKKG